MPTGSFDLDDAPPPLYGDAVQVHVARCTPGAAHPYNLLPNIRCTRIDLKEGPTPPVARFQYIMDDALSINFGWPSQFEEIWPLTAQGQYVVNADDRIVVVAMNPDDTFMVLFHGFAQIPQVDISPQGQAVTFVATGVAVRAWDDPISGRVQRNADPDGINTTDASADVQVDLPTHFNPANHELGSRGGYLPNASPKDKDSQVEGVDDLDHPVFLDPAIKRDPDPRQYWTVPMAIKYLLAEYNKDQTYVDMPTFVHLDNSLVAKYPREDEGTFDPDDCDTASITVRDYDASNKAWPEAVAELLSYAGFGMYWDLDIDDETTEPVDRLVIFRKDAATQVTPKRIYLDENRPDFLDPSRNNVNQLHLVRDQNHLINAWQVETAQKQIEVSMVLAPLYRPTPGDYNTSIRKQFVKSSFLPETTAAIRRKYRWYGVDECGDGHWTQAQEWATTPCDFSAVFPPDDDDTPSYAVRYRPGSTSIVAKDTEGKPLKAELAISFDYQGDTAAPWDGSGTWHTIHGGWKPLHDRLGIEVDVPDVTEWSAGKSTTGILAGALAATQLPGGKINGVRWWSDPPSGKPTNGLQPVFRLTTMIEDDLRMPISMPKRLASPTKFPRWKSVDGRDHFQYTTVDPSSSNFAAVGGTGEDPYVVRDDTDRAFAHAHQLRAAHEFPPISGSATIPYFSRFYRIGDRVSRIQGRDVSLQVNVGENSGEKPTFPWITAISFSFEGDRQTTTLQFSDRRREIAANI